jgi:SAM-dependent methyltransferase
VSDGIQTGLPRHERFVAVPTCWVCGGRRLAHFHENVFDLAAFSKQDPELAEYTGSRLPLVRCQDCGFGQPSALPGLPQFFERLYDQQWSEDWMASEFESEAKDLIIRTVLAELGQRVPSHDRTLLDIGSHVGRLMSLAERAGWQPEGLELNRRTSAFAASRTRLPVHRATARELAASGQRFGAVALIDVLEHIPQPLAVLQSVHRLLAPNGWVAVKVPCGRNQLLKERVRSWLKPGYDVAIAKNLVHVNHFSVASLRRALANAGFVNVTITIGAPEILGRGIRAPRRLVANAVRLGIYRLGRLLPGGIHTPAALNLQAYGQRA